MLNFPKRRECAAPCSRPRIIASSPTNCCAHHGAQIFSAVPELSSRWHVARMRCHEGVHLLSRRVLIGQPSRPSRASPLRSRLQSPWILEHRRARSAHGPPANPCTGRQTAYLIVIHIYSWRPNRPISRRGPQILRKGGCLWKPDHPLGTRHSGPSPMRSSRPARRKPSRTSPSFLLSQYWRRAR